MADFINETTGRQLSVQFVIPKKFSALKAGTDEGGKPIAFFQKLLSWYEAIAQGEAGVIDPLMAKVLGREPVAPQEAIRALFTDRDYE